LEAYILDWLNLLVRWATWSSASAWYGASLYFIWLDYRLEPVKRSEDRTKASRANCGRSTDGGFYRAQNSPSRRRCSPKRCTGSRGRPTDFNHGFSPCWCCSIT